MLSHKWMILILVAIACMLLACGLIAALGAGENPIDEVTDNTRQILTAALSHPPGMSQKDLLPSNLWIDDECWQFIQEAGVSSSNSYTLTVLGIDRDKVYSLPDPTELAVRVYFASNHQLSILYKHNFVVNCWVQDPK